VLPFPPPDRLDQPFQRVLQKLPSMQARAQQARNQADDLLAQLKALPTQAERVARVRRSRRFRSWALCEKLFAESRHLGFSDPGLAESFAELAIECAWSMDQGTYSKEAISDLLARGWAYLANVRRMSSDFQKAEETLLMAYFLIEQGTGDSLVQAEIFSLEASLRRNQRHFEEALHLLGRVNGIYRRAGESHLQGRTLLKIALTKGDMDQPEEAIPILKEGLQLTDKDRDARLRFCFQHTLIELTNQIGHHEEASRLLQESQPFFAQFEDPWTRLRARWLSGQISEGLRHFDEAEAAFREVRNGFIGEGLGYDAALASLHLAALLFRCGRTDEIKVLAGEMLPIFESRDVHREAIAALVLFQKAAQMERLTLEMVEGFSRYLERARNDVRLRFEVPS